MFVNDREVWTVGIENDARACIDTSSAGALRLEYRRRSDGENREYTAHVVISASCLVPPSLIDL